MSTQVSTAELANEVRQAIALLKTSGNVEKTGIVTRIGDGVAWIYGLSGAGYSEMLEIEGSGGMTINAFALNLMEDEIGAVLLGDDTKVKAGAKVRLSGTVLEVPVGPELVGRVVDPLGRPLDGKGPIATKLKGLVERPCPRSFGA
jgi:F-type H+/Na+-transporting ATPase subunit alpha